MSCIFCQIISGEIPSTLLYEDDELVAFRDINPKAPTHILIVPKKHIADLTEMTDDDLPLVGKMTGLANKLAREEGVDEKGYRVVINCKEEGGQEVWHLHMHLVGGKPLRSSLV